MLLGSTGTWHQHPGAFQTAWHFTTHGQPIGKTGRKNREGKATQGDVMIYVNKSIPVPHVCPELYGKLLVKDPMYMPDPVVELGESMEQVAQKFHDTKKYNLPVLDQGKYGGFVSRANVFSAYREMLKDVSEE